MSGNNVNIQASLPVVPMIHNLPSGFLEPSSLFLMKHTTCLKWFMYNRDEIEYENSYLVNSVLNDPLKSYCREYSKDMPYFQENSKNKSINEELFDVLEEMNKEEMKFA